MGSIWGSAEASAWSRGLNWRDYLEFHKHTGCKGVPLSKLVYYRLYEILNMEQEMDMNKDNID